MGHGHQATLFVTGGTGFLGQALLPALAAAGYAVHALVRPGSLARLPQSAGLTPQPGDLLHPVTYASALQGCAAVVHAAGLFRFWGPAHAFDRLNRVGTQRLAEAAVRAGVRRFVFVSTLAVIGRPLAQGVVTEATPPRPREPYQHSKYAAERALRRIAARSGMEVVILRPGGFYGPGGTYGLNRLLVLDPLRGVRLQVGLGRRHIFPPVYVPDVVQGILAALERGRAGEVYHLHDDPPTLREVNWLVGRLAGIGAWRLPAPRLGLLALAAVLEAWARLNHREPFYPLNLRHYVFPDWRASNAKARRELGFHPTPLAEGLRAAVAWARAYLRGAPAPATSSDALAGHPWPRPGPGGPHGR